MKYPSKKPKNILVPTMEWQIIHPKGVICKSDAYYAKLSTRLANKLKEMFGEDYDITDEELKYLAIDLSAYLEDKINDINLWNSFIELYRAKFNRYYPFYEVNEDEILTDEPNLPDVKFLIWYRLKTINHDKILNPLSTALEHLARSVYNILQDEYEVAPESPEFYEAIYSTEKYEDVISVRSLCGWLATKAYLTGTYDTEGCFEKIFSIFNHYFNDDSHPGMIAYGIDAYYSFSVEVGPLSLIAPQWLGKMLELSGKPDLQKYASLISEIETYTLLPYEIKSVGEDDFVVENLNGDLMTVSFDPLPENVWKDIRAGRIMVAPLFFYDGKWKVNGISSFTHVPESIEKSQLEYKTKKESTSTTYKFHMKENNEIPIGVAGTYDEFSKRFKLDKAVAKGENIDKIQKDKDILYFINTDSSVSLLPDNARIVALKDNPYYSKDDAAKYGALLICGDNSTKELRDYLIENRLLPDARLGGNFPDTEAKLWFAENAPFLSVVTHTEEVQFNMP